MKIEYLELSGYMGIMQGMQRDNIKINFGNNRITLIKGPNGSGKSTLLSTMSIYPDGNGMFIPNEQAEKKMIINNGGVRYKIDIIHPIGSKGERKTTKAYIAKEEGNGWMEHNPTGTLTSYKDYIESEFELDPNYISLSYLSTENKGLAKKTPAERKKTVNAVVDSVEVYNNMHKVLNKRSTIYKSMLNKMAEKLTVIGDEDNLKAELNSIIENLGVLHTQRAGVVEAISTNKAAIALVDPDSSIQNLYSSVRIEIERYNAELQKYLSDQEFLYKEISLFDREMFSDVETTSKVYADIKSMSTELNNKKSNLANNLNDYLTDKEQQLRSISSMMNRIEGLQSEYNYDLLLANLEKQRTTKAEYEKIFEDIHIKNAINISKDEYITGLNTLNDIKDEVRAIESSNFLEDIRVAIDYILSGTNIVKDVDKCRSTIDTLKETISAKEKFVVYNQGLLEQTKVLMERPKECTIDSCGLIRDALEAAKREPEKAISETEAILLEAKSNLALVESELERFEASLAIINQINIMLRNIHNNEGIIKKLPIGAIFLNRDNFLNAIRECSIFEEVDELYKYINYANMFEEYKSTCKLLSDLESEYTIYEAKAEVIDDLNKDLERMNNNLSDIVMRIDNTNKEIVDIDNNLSTINSHLSKLDDLLIIQNKIKSIRESISESENKRDVVAKNMEQISGNIKAIAELENQLKLIDDNIAPLEDRRANIKYSLTMLNEYKEEYEEYQKSYTLLEVLKEYSSPTKKGIQNLFIKVYMAQTLQLTNDLLSLFFNGRLKLLPYHIDENEFSIPYYSETTGLTTDDISSCSRSEKAMIDLSLSGALMVQGSSKYNIMRLDEIDEGLDAENRMGFFTAVNTIDNILNIEQTIMVSHTSELSVDSNVDIIKLGNSTELGELGGNIIWQNN